MQGGHPWYRLGWGPMLLRPKLRSARGAPTTPVGACAICVLACAAVLVGCSSGPTSSAELREAIAPHLSELASFDRWARRLSLADGAFRSEEALEEAAFAPLRRVSGVRAAWLNRVGPDPRGLHYPSEGPAAPQAGWIRIQSEELGELEAQVGSLTLFGQREDVTLIRRSRDAPGGAVLQVTMAFGEGPPEAADPDDD